MMTPEQRYLFDVTGYLHIENAVSGEALKAAQAAADAYINASPGDLPPGFDSSGKHLPNGFAFSRALEALTMLPATWPIIKELTDNRPQLARGTMIADRAGLVESEEALRLHCAREDYGRDRNCFENRNGRIYCDDFVVFPYLTDVHPGDGGLLVVPGSHKAEFERPEHIFNNGTIDDVNQIPRGVENITPKAGDAVIISELLTHGALPWKPKDRYRCFLVLRYRPQDRGESRVPEEVRERLAPETLELIARATPAHIKKIVKEDVVTLT